MRGGATTGRGVFCLAATCQPLAPFASRMQASQPECGEVLRFYFNMVPYRHRRSNSGNQHREERPGNEQARGFSGALRGIQYELKAGHTACGRRPQCRQSCVRQSVRSLAGSCARRVLAAACSLLRRRRIRACGPSPFDLSLRPQFRLETYFRRGARMCPKPPATPQDLLAE